MSAGEGKPVLLTQPEAKVLWQASFSDHAKSFPDYCAELHERGLMEPIDPLVYEARRLVLEDGTTRTVNQIEAIRDGKAGHEKVAYALAGLRKGREMFGCQCPKLTRETVVQAYGIALARVSNGPSFIDRLHAALTDGGRDG